MTLRIFTIPIMSAQKGMSVSTAPHSLTSPSLKQNRPLDAKEASSAKEEHEIPSLYNTTKHLLKLANSGIFVLSVPRLLKA